MKHSLALLCTVLFIAGSAAGYGQEVKLVDKNALHNPFDTLHYTRVVVYIFATPEAIERYKKIPSIVREGKLHPSAVLPGKELSQKEVEQFVHIVVDTATYGGEDIACYQPGVGLVFYDEYSNITGHVNLCFECDKLVSDPYIPAKDYYNEALDNTADIILPRNTFSTEGRRKLVELFCGLGMLCE